MDKIRKKAIIISFVSVLVSLLVFASIFMTACADKDNNVVEAPKVVTVKIIDGKGSGKYNKGSIVVIKATPTDEQIFVGWYEGDNLISNEAEYSFKVEKDTEYKAVYSNKYSFLSITGGGYEAESGLSKVKLEVGSEVTIAFRNDQNKSFVCFEIGDEKITQNPYTFKIGEENVNVNTVYATEGYYIYVKDGKINGEVETSFVKFEEGESCTIEYIEPAYSMGNYFYSWQYMKNNEEVRLSREKEYTFDVTETMYIYPEVVAGYDLSVQSGIITIADEDAISVENIASDSESDESTAVVVDGSVTTITYLKKNDEPNGFRYWYVYDDSLEKQILSYNSTYTFTLTKDTKIYAELGDDTHYNVSLTGGVIEEYDAASAEVLNGRTITLMADETGGKIFQGWKDGTKNIDGTDKIVSYDPIYTLTVDSDINLSASYSDKLVTPSYVNENLNDIFKYGENKSNHDLQYSVFLEFMNGGENIFAEVGVKEVKLYIYASPDDDRSRYLATMTINMDTSKVTFEGNGESAVKTPSELGWANNKANLWVESRTSLKAQAFFEILNNVIPDYVATEDYFFAMQLIGEDGYENSDISSCSRIAFTESGVRSTEPVDGVIVTPDYYTVTVDGEVINSHAQEGNEITLTFDKEGYRFIRWEVVSGDVTIDGNTFTMPAGDVEINAVCERIEYTITAESDANGSIVVQEKAYFNDDVTVTVNPAEGYELLKLYAVGNDTIVFNKSGENAYTFKMVSENVTLKAEFKLEGSIAHEAEVTVSGGTIEGHEGTSVSVEAGTEITVVATETGGQFFQGWKDGTKNVDGTDKVLSYDPTYTFIAEEGTLNLTASYSNKLVIPEYVTLNDIFRYGLNGTTLQYLEFLRFSSDVFNGTGVKDVKMYVYANPDDARSEYLATITFHMDSPKTATFEGNGATQTYTFNDWTNGTNIYFEGGNGVEFYDYISAVIDGYDANANYFFAMQLIGEEGYENSDISSCSRIAFTESGKKSTEPVA